MKGKKKDLDMLNFYSTFDHVSDIMLYVDMHKAQASTHVTSAFPFSVCHRELCIELCFRTTFLKIDPQAALDRSRTC